MKIAFAKGTVKLGVQLATAAAVILPMIALTPLARAAPPAPANGSALYKAQCAMCHSTISGRNMLGPSLAGVANRKAGSVAGFAYSPAMKKSKLKWDKATLDRYLADPRKTVPGTKMIYAGQKDAAKRAALVAYLMTLK
ncbi:MAG: c-type cytochrome [Qipengyuania sp.]|jgi:cytochrome c|nr:c-type cytochrome [Qipengyuania sp.]